MDDPFCLITRIEGLGEQKPPSKQPLICSLLGIFLLLPNVHTISTVIIDSTAVVKIPSRYSRIRIRITANV